MDADWLKRIAVAGAIGAAGYFLRTDFSAKERQKERQKEAEDAKKRLLFSVKPKVAAPLDPNFVPAILAKRKYLEAAKDCKEKVQWALPRSNGCARGELPVFPWGSKDFGASTYLAGVLIQEMIWQRGAYELQLSGPAKVCEELKKMYSSAGAYKFEVETMPNVSGTPDKPFEVKIVPAKELPKQDDQEQVCGKEASGYRLAFDLGKSDIKIVAVIDDKPVYNKETEWDVTNEDPDYHYKEILKAMQPAKEKLGGRIDAIGGSATGTISGDTNEATWCDLFPNVPKKLYQEKVVDIFKRLAEAISGRKDVPLKVINDGEVTALAAVKKGHTSVMGISMGSSEGAGYANKDGNLLGWINELCYLRLDLNPDAPTDAWTKGAHTGISHMYLGQRAATRLAAQVPAVSRELPEDQIYPHANMCTIKHEPHAKCLKKVQEAMNDPAREAEASKIYKTIGVYLGYALGQYCEFYDIKNVMILGRVSKGRGGTVVLDTAKKVLEKEFPENSGIGFHEADETFKVVGQCIAAAGLPILPVDPLDAKFEAQVDPLDAKFEAQSS